MDEITKDGITDNQSEQEDGIDALEDIKTPEQVPEQSNQDNGNSAPASDTQHEVEIDYETVIAEDLAALKNEFPELRSIENITELDNPLRYAALRDLGLTPAEAYLATLKRTKRDNRAHLTTAYGKNASVPSGAMTQRELAEAREIFGNLGDLEIQRLYKRVTT